MSKEIYLDSPNVGDREKSYIAEAVDSGFVSAAGPLVPEFEEKFRRYLGAKKAVSTNSGTAAEHMTLHELGIKKGDEVIVPALTFVATVNPILYVGATPVFADVDIKTWNISPEGVESKITGKTKAVIAVHLYGNPSAMDEITSLARNRGLYLIEDATESLGAKYRGGHTGTFGDFGFFSFNGNKIITTGSGGMVVGADESRLSHIKFLINQAKDASREYYHPEVGFNYRMTNIEAALGLAQMERLDGFLEKKRRFNDIYRSSLKSVKGIRFQEESPGGESSWWLTSIMFEKGVDIEALQYALKKKGVATRRIFIPIPELEPYKPYGKSGCVNSSKIYQRGLSLPSSTLNSEDDIVYISETLKELI